MNNVQNPINQPLRKDRAKDDDWIRSFLKKVPFGMLATDHEGQPFIKPTSYAYDQAEQAIYIHGAVNGRMRSNMEANPRVCFCVAEMGRLLPADTAMEVGVEYASAVVYGRMEEVTDTKQATYGLQLLLDRYFSKMKPGVDYREIQPEEVGVTAVYRIRIESWSGKETHSQPDFPGAFYFQAPE